MKDSAGWNPWNNDGWSAAIPILNARTPKGEPGPKHNWDLLRSEWGTVSVKQRRFTAIVGLIVAKDRFNPIQTHHSHRSGTTNKRGCTIPDLGRKWDVRSEVPILNARTPKVKPKPKYNWNSLRSGVWIVPVRPKEVHCNCKTVLVLTQGEEHDANCDVQGYISSFWVMIEYKEYWGAKDRDSSLAFQGKELI